MAGTVQSILEGRLVRCAHKRQYRRVGGYGRHNMERIL